jgi:hypothetical protein
VLGARVRPPVPRVAIFGGCAGLALGAFVGAVLGLLGPMAASFVVAITIGGIGASAGYLAERPK